MANRIFSAAMSFYCSLMLSSSFMTASQGIKLAAVGGATAPAATSPAAPAVETLAPPQDAPAAKKEEPLRKLAEEIRKDNNPSAKTGTIGPEMGVFFELVPAPKPGETAASTAVKYYVERKDDVIHVVLVTDKLQIIYVLQDTKKKTVTAYLTGVDGVVKKAGTSVMPSPNPTEIAAKDAKEGFDKEVKHWKDKDAAAVAQNPAPAEKK